VFLRFLYSFRETDFLGVSETIGGGGDFLDTLGVSCRGLFGDGEVSSRLRFCPEGLEFECVDFLKLAGELREADLSSLWNAPGRVGLSGRGIRGDSSKQNRGGRVGLRNGGSALSPRF
jgi:hypothetical protein